LEPDATTPSQTPPASSPSGSLASGPVTIDDAPAPVVEAEAGFMAATLAELRRVVWPSRQQLFSESVAVILMVSLSAAAIAAVDRFYGWASTQVFG